MKMRYFKRKWNETRGDQYNDWGYSEWFFETDNEGNPVRHLEKYQNGKILKYSSESLKDAFGFLSDQKLDLIEFKEFEITETEFIENWT